MVKIEGDISEVKALLEQLMVSSPKKVKEVVSNRPATKSKPKRKLSSWNKYVKNPKNHIKFKSGKNKGKLDLAKMSKAHKRSMRRK